MPEILPGAGRLNNPKLLDQVRTALWYDEPERPNPDGAADRSVGVMFMMSIPLNGVAGAPARHSARVVSHGVTSP